MGALCSTMPTMSQVLKAAARLKGIQRRNEIAEEVVEPPPKTRGKGKKPRTPAIPRTIDCSVTIAIGGGDIPTDMLEKVEEFIDKECILGLCALERGGGQMRLHCQMICKILESSGAAISKLIRRCIGWADPNSALPEHHVTTKFLRGTELHTYVGMIGYYMKDRGEDHFRYVHRNVIPQQIEDGLEEYVQHGTPTAKNRAILTHKNLLEKAAVYCKYKMQSQLNSTIPCVVLRMVKFGQFYPSSAWVVPLRNGGMDYDCAASLWKAMMFPHLIEMDNVRKIFFEQFNPASRLRALGREQLASNLIAAREGAEHNYILIDDADLGLDAPTEKDVLLAIEDVPENSSDGARHQCMTTTSAPMYIPVHNHKRNFDHGL